MEIQQFTTAEILTCYTPCAEHFSISEVVILLANPWAKKIRKRNYNLQQKIVPKVSSWSKVNLLSKGNQRH